MEYAKLDSKYYCGIDLHSRRLCKSHPDFFIFDSLPGAVFVPWLIAAFGSDRNRYPSAEDLLKYSGVAPVLERSGKKKWVHWRYACPKFIRQTFVEWAGPTVYHSFWAKIYYQKKGSRDIIMPPLSELWLSSESESCFDVGKIKSPTMKPNT